MAGFPGSVAITGFIAPTDSSDTFATHDSALGRGGLQEHATLILRDAIPADRRRVGMIVFVIETAHYYSLIGDITNLSWRDLGTTLGGSDALQDQITNLTAEVTSISDRVAVLEQIKPTYELDISLTSTLERNELLYIGVIPDDVLTPLDGTCKAVALTPDLATLAITVDSEIVGSISFDGSTREGVVFFLQTAVINKNSVLTITAPSTATGLADVGIHLTFIIRENI